MRKPFAAQGGGEPLQWRLAPADAQRRRVHLQEDALTRQFSELATIRMELRAPFRVRERHAETSPSDLKEQLVEPSDLEAGSLDQQVGASLAEGRQTQLFRARVKRPRERHLGAADEVEPDRFTLQHVSHRLATLADFGDVNAREIRPKVRRRNERRDPRFLGRAHQLDRLAEIGRAVVQPREDVSVNVNKTCHRHCEIKLAMPEGTH